MFCQECGKPVDAGIRYCPHCGANVSEQAPAPPAAAQMQPGTGEAVPEIGAYAGFGRRLAARLIDYLILGTASMILQGLLGVAGLGGSLDAPQRPEDWIAIFGIIGMSTGVNVVCAWLYEALLMSSQWQATLGKRALGIVVTDENGERISFARATGRHFATWISGLLLFIGYLMQPFTPKKQALHDMIAGTLAVRP